MHRKFSCEHALGLILALIMCALGLIFMAGLDYKMTSARQAEAALKAFELEKEEAQAAGVTYDVPVSGMNVIISEFVAFSEENAASYLSTAIFSENADESEYINDDGTSIGKYIVCTASSGADIYAESWDLSDESADEGEVIATIETYGLATLISEDDGWCHILSNGIYGYVKAEDFAFGGDAQALDAKTYIDTVVVSEDDTYLYEIANSRATVLCVLWEGAQLEIVSSGSTFTKVYVEGAGEGYVKTSLIEEKTVRYYAVSVEETAQNQQQLADAIAAGEALSPRFIWPVSSTRITSYFGYRNGSLHSGIDIKASRGASIYAVMDAVVEDVGYGSSSGYYVILNHGDGLYTLYYHMLYRSDLEEGESVKQGDVIGYVGSTGNSTGYHLHFAVGVGSYHNEDHVNPLEYLY